MQSIQNQSFHTEDHFFSSLDSQIEGHGYDIEAHQLQLPTAGKGLYRSDTHCFLQLVLSPEHRLQGTYPAWREQRTVGQLVFVPPGTTLEWCWSSGSQRTVTCMFELEKIGALGAYRWDWGAVDLSATLDIRNEYLVMGMRKLAEESNSPGFASELQIESTLTLMALELRKQFMATTCKPYAVKGRLSAQQLRLVREYVNANLGNDFSLAEAAQVCDISARVLSELFRQTTGMTIRQFVANARLAKARALLSSSDLLIKQVGFECGFQRSAAFVAAFRKAAGLTPAEYRRRHA